MTTDLGRRRAVRAAGPGIHGRPGSFGRRRPTEPVTATWPPPSRSCADRRPRPGSPTSWCASAATRWRSCWTPAPPCAEPRPTSMSTSCASQTQEGQRLVTELAGGARPLAGEAGQSLSDETVRELEETLHAGLVDPAASDAIRVRASHHCPPLLGLRSARPRGSRPRPPRRLRPQCPGPDPLARAGALGSAPPEPANDTRRQVAGPDPATAQQEARPQAEQAQQVEQARRRSGPTGPPGRRGRTGRSPAPGRRGRPGGSSRPGSARTCSASRSAPGRGTGAAQGRGGRGERRRRRSRPVIGERPTTGWPRPRSRSTGWTPPSPSSLRSGVALGSGPGGPTTSRPSPAAPRPSAPTTSPMMPMVRAVVSVPDAAAGAESLPPTVLPGAVSLRIGVGLGGVRVGRAHGVDPPDDGPVGVGLQRLEDHLSVPVGRLWART